MDYLGQKHNKTQSEFVKCKLLSRESMFIPRNTIFKVIKITFMYEFTQVTE